MPRKQSWITVRVKRTNLNILRNIENDFSATHWLNWGEVPPFSPITWNCGHTERGQKGNGGREEGRASGSREREMQKEGREESRQRGGLQALEGRGRPIQRLKNTTVWVSARLRDQALLSGLLGPAERAHHGREVPGAYKRQRQESCAWVQALEETQTSGSETLSSGGLAKPHKTIIKE